MFNVNTDSLPICSSIFRSFSSFELVSEHADSYSVPSSNYDQKFSIKAFLRGNTGRLRIKAKWLKCSLTKCCDWHIEQKFSRHPVMHLIFWRFKTRKINGIQELAFIEAKSKLNKDFIFDTQKWKHGLLRFRLYLGRISFFSVNWTVFCLMVRS